MVVVTRPPERFQQATYRSDDSNERHRCASPGRKCAGFFALAQRRRASPHGARGPARRAGEGSNLYAAFVERGLHFLEPKGMLGTITSHTGFFLVSLQKWREAVLLQEARLIVYTNLGYGVLDASMVETVAYCLEAVRRADTA